MTIENSSKNKLLDAFQGHINTTIEHFLGRGTYFQSAPYLSDEEIDHDNQFFKRNSISPIGGLTSDEYKTISYLAPFYKNKANYDIGCIDRYMNILGYFSDNRIAEISCLDIEKNYSADCDGNYISFTDYMTLDSKGYADLIHKISSSLNLARYGISIKSEIESFVVFDGFDIGFDSVSLK